MVGGTQVFRLLTGVEVIAQILGIVFLVHGVDLILEQFADPVGGHLMEHPHAALPQQLPASVHGVEHEGEVMTAEGLFIVIAVYKIVRHLMKHGENDHIVGDEGEEQGAIRFAHPLGLLNTAEFVGLAVQVIQWPKQENDVKGVVCIVAEIQSVALHQINGVLGVSFLRKAAMFSSDSSRADTW